MITTALQYKTERPAARRAFLPDLDSPLSREGRLCRQQAVFHPEQACAGSVKLSVEKISRIGDQRILSGVQCIGRAGHVVWRGRSGFVTSLMQRSTPTPSTRPTATSVNQCANNTMRVVTKTAPVVHIAFLVLVGSNVAADANAPT
jgi:hypothetical protein